MQRDLKHAMAAASFHRTLAAILLAVAGAILLVAYLMICVRTGSLWPWGLVVHEDGRRTLLLTILYFGTPRANCRSTVANHKYANSFCSLLRWQR